MIKLELNGDWKLRNEEGKTLCPVKVPGSVISGLYAAGKIEHPYYRDNEYVTRELFQKDYEFVRQFEISKELWEEDELTLICEGLDTLTQIYINGSQIASTDNMHRTYSFSVKEYLKQGENEIRIVFQSVLQYIDNYSYQENKTIHYVPCGAMKGNQLVRKGHSMFGWDWGPQLVDAGIWRDIYMVGSSTARIEDVRIRQYHEKNGSVRVKAEITLSEETDRAVAMTLEEPGSNQLRFIPAQEKAPRYYEAEIAVETPQLWWPNGYGEHPLYRLTVSVEDGQTIEKKIGLRTLTISQEADEWGNEFAFMVNGVKIFTRGGNYIPENAVYPWIKKEQIDYLLSCCVRANFNCIRVWGGGYYPSDTFYDLCDQYGLIVWQDLMYACNVYDVTDDFANTVRQETIDNVRRIRHHASLGLWCGNNEIESAWDHWGDFQTESKYLRADYIKLFEEILPKALREADDTTFYWPSSPSSGGCFDEPDSDKRGDVHYWDVWHGQKPFNDYQKYYFRFCSEFGFQSFPCLKTVKTFTEEKDRNIFSKVMESHQKNDSANGKMLYYLSENFKYPRDFKSLLYVTQVLQGMAIKSGVDHWRRNRGRCMGTLYWQINDNWPVASWASIDYYGRWKALHYMAAKFYAPVAVSIHKTEDFAAVYLENETFETVKCKEVFLRIRDTKLHIVKEWKASAEVTALSSAKLISCDIDQDWMKRDDLYIEAEVVLEDGNILYDTDTLIPFKHMELPKPKLTTEVKEMEDSFEITVQSDVFTPFVELDFDDADVIFSDNFFTISNEKPVVITLKKEDIMQGSFASADNLKERLAITTVVDTF